jgi:hypothetical protein
LAALCALILRPDSVSGNELREDELLVGVIRTDRASDSELDLHTSRAGTGGSSLVDMAMADAKYAAEDELSFGIILEGR